MVDRFPQPVDNYFLSVNVRKIAVNLSIKMFFTIAHFFRLKICEGHAINYFQSNPIIQ
jgi:hypothetical protein